MIAQRSGEQNDENETQVNRIKYEKRGGHHRGGGHLVDRHGNRHCRKHEAERRVRGPTSLFSGYLSLHACRLIR